MAHHPRKMDSFGKKRIQEGELLILRISFTAIVTSFVKKITTVNPVATFLARHPRCAENGLVVMSLSLDAQFSLQSPTKVQRCMCVFSNCGSDFSKTITVASRRNSQAGAILSRSGSVVQPIEQWKVVCCGRVMIFVAFNATFQGRFLHLLSSVRERQPRSAAVTI